MDGRQHASVVHHSQCIPATSTGMDANIKLPDLETVVADLNDLEAKLEKAKQKHAKMDPYLIRIKYDLERCKAKRKKLEKSKKFLEEKFDENAKRMDKMFFEENKCDITAKSFENYKKETTTMQESFPEVSQTNDVLEEELLVKTKEDLKEEVEKNNKSYKEMLEKISNVNLTVLLE